MGQMISVIVPVYKVEEYIDQCIDSIVNQTYKNLEIILVDDGSPDNCPQICDNWAIKDKRIKVIHKKNGGLSEARNYGIDIATGDYISFVDSDDWIDKRMYETMLNLIQKEKADICACGITTCYPTHQTYQNIRSVIGDSSKVFELLYDDAAYPVCAWNKLYRRKCWSEIRFPVGKICEDAFTTYKLIHISNKIVQIEMPLYFYRIREASIMTSSFNHAKMDQEEAWRKNYEFIENNYPHLKKDAFDFYLKRIMNLISSIPIKNENMADYNYLYDILSKNLLYVLFKSKFKIKAKARFLVDFLKLERMT